jgi:hypothetical protein
MAERKTKLKCCPKCGGRPKRAYDPEPDRLLSYAVICYKKGHFIFAVGSTETEADVNWNNGKITEAA